MTAPRVTLTPAMQALAQRCDGLRIQIDTLHDQRRALLDELEPMCPVRPGDRLDPVSRYQPGLLVQTVTASVERGGEVVWCCRGKALTKTGKVHATQTSYRYIYGHAPDQEQQA